MIRVFDNIKIIWKYKELLRYFTLTDLKLIYRNKFLGYVWTLLDPIMMMFTYTVLVVFIFKRGEPQFPILLFSALLAWRWFTFSVVGSVKSITGKAKLVKSVNFPKATLPISRVLVGLANYVFALLAFVPILFIFKASIGLQLLWLPLLVGIQLMFTLGTALLSSVLGIYYRDIENVLQFTLKMWFYLSPALYSAKDRIPEQYLGLYMTINPLAPLLESYKNIFVRGQGPDEYIMYSLIWSILVFSIGIYIFSIKEPYIARDI